MKIINPHTEGAFIMPRIDALYLNRAKKAELKVLYYLFANGSSFAPEKACAALGETSETVQAALAFWRCAGVIEEIEEVEEVGNAEEVRRTDTTDKKERKAESAAAKASDRTSGAEGSPEPTVTAHPASTVPHAPDSYTLVEIASARDKNAAFASLVSYLEKLSGRLYNAAEQGIVLYLYDTLGLECELIMGVAQYCASKGKSSIRYIQKTVMNITDEGVHTYEELEAYLEARRKKDDYRSMVKRVLGLERALSKPECGQIDRWEKDGVSEELVTLAYEKTVAKINKPQVAYMSKILETWQEKGFKTAAEVESAAKAPDGAPPTSSSGSRLDFDLNDFFEKP